MASRMQGRTDPSEKRRIIIVDDHPIVRQGLTQLINQEDDLYVCGQAEDAHQAMRAIRELNPDLVIVDISLRTTSGIELIKDIKVQFPNLPVLTLSMHDEAIYAERALRAGARGYIMKQEATEEVVNAIRRVLAGTVYVSQGMAAKMVSKIIAGPSEKGTSPVDRLSDRELEVFRLIGEGYGTREMAEKLYLSVKTIETYRAHIKEKLDLQDANELLRAAIRWANAQR
ncbi:MAG TPA: response regulator transcription factor [Sedimentisphaerales bacterium]|nr:response regulator transcription factor [Sedimentisphaerales bacterium]HRS12775.1 response regulator transcription factor [Sedimentisphaerales bacterium]HRV49385.1 response regulator transcription factor [Sedimentisphaerales bacterium]